MSWECGEGCGRVISDSMYRASIECGGVPPTCLCLQTARVPSHKRQWSNWIRVEEVKGAEKKS